VEGIENTRVLLTGSSGFIGSHLGRKLLEMGADLHLLDLPGRLDFRIRDYSDKAHVHEADLGDLESLKEIIQEIRPELVFHLASITSVERSLERAAEITRNNLIGTINLVSALNGIPYRRFVNTGTCEEYGDNLAPFKEEQTVNPVSPYSAAKAASTIFCGMFQRTLGLPIVTVRPFLTYGPFQDTKMLIPHTIVSALRGKSFKMTGGKQTREFNYISDIVNGFILAATAPDTIGRIINIGNGIEYPVRRVVEKILRIMNSDIRPEIGAIPYRAGETWHFYCDNERARRLLGWSPRVSLDEGLEKTISWYRKAFESGELFEYFPGASVDSR